MVSVETDGALLVQSYLGCVKWAEERHYFLAVI